MTSRGRAAGKVPVQVDAAVWMEEVERYAPRSPARVDAERERRGFERGGVGVADLLPCDEEGSDGTRLGGLLKVYVPIGDGPPSLRPFGIVFAPAVDGDSRLHLKLVAFGERHPRRGTRSVYERAHRRLHGRYPDQ